MAVTRGSANAANPTLCNVDALHICLSHCSATTSMSQMGNRSVTWEDEDRKTTALSLEDSHRHALYILENKQYKVTGYVGGFP